MKTNERIMAEMELSGQVLELVDQAQNGELDIPRGDLQGVIEAIISRAVAYGISIGRAK